MARLNIITVSIVYTTDEETQFQSFGGNYLTIFIKNFKSVYLFSPSDCISMDLFSRTDRTSAQNCSTTMFTSALEKIKMEMNSFILWYIHLKKILKFCKIMM